MSSAKNSTLHVRAGYAGVAPSPKNEHYTAFQKQRGQLLDNAIEAYRKFDEGSPKKYIIDPHGSLKQAA